MQLNHLLAELMPQHLAQALGSAAALLGHLLGYQTLALLGAAAGWWLVTLAEASTEAIAGTSGAWRQIW
jgi:hypothetical protein